MVGGSRLSRGAIENYLRSTVVNAEETIKLLKEPTRPYFTLWMKDSKSGRQFQVTGWNPWYEEE